MAFNLVEAEGLQEFWVQELEPPKRDYPKNYEMNYTNFEMSLALEDKPDFYCWQGSRIPQWFE